MRLVRAMPLTLALVGRSMAKGRQVAATAVALSPGSVAPQKTQRASGNKGNVHHGRFQAYPQV